MSLEDTATNEKRANELLDRHWRMLIGGELVSARSGKTFDTVNPASGVTLATVPFAQAEDVQLAYDCASAAQRDWKEVPVVERVSCVRHMIEVLSANASDLGLLDAINGGNPVSGMSGDVFAAISKIDYYASIVREIKGVTTTSSSGDLSLSICEPYGVVGRITPFNHPLLFVAASLVPPVLMGNAVILKGPEQAPLSQLLLGELIRDVFPRGVVNLVTGDGPITGDAIVRHPHIKKISFTGSAATGMRIQRSAAEVAVKKISMELGGKNACIVLPDADLDRAVPGAVRAMNFGWSSQSCSSLSRLFLHESLHDNFLDRAAGIASRIRIGNPIDPDTEMGCLVSQTQYDKVIAYIESAISEGARLITGGGKPTGAEFSSGTFVSPTIFANVTEDMRIANEEIFGPVLSVFKWTDEAEVLRMANSVNYGLTGSVWTENLDSALRVARALDTGYVWINGAAGITRGVPFGGRKNSGIDYETSIDELMGFAQYKGIAYQAPQ